MSLIEEKIRRADDEGEKIGKRSARQNWVDCF